MKVMWANQYALMMGALVNNELDGQWPGTSTNNQGVGIMLATQIQITWSSLEPYIYTRFVPESNIYLNLFPCLRTFIGTEWTHCENIY